MTGAAPPGALVVAVDGGGSKTDAWAVDLEGTVVARARGAGSSPQLLGAAPALEIVDGLVRSVIDAAHPRPVIQVCVYLSGLDLPAEIEAFHAAIAPLPWATGATGRPAVLDNDLFPLLRVGTPARDAVAVVCGTGINCIGVRRDGATARFPALGMISGDWGGGGFLGEQALWHAARAVDGRGPATLLTDRVPEALRYPSVRALTEALHFGRLDLAALARLSPVLFAAARDGDEVAGAVVDRQAQEIVLLVTAAMRSLDLGDREVPVVLGGGVLAAADPRLLSGIEQGLAQSAPLARTVLVRAAPIWGAAMLALEHVGRHSAAQRLTDAADSPDRGFSASEPRLSTQGPSTSS